MVVMLNGLVVGVVDKNEYSARELENAGFVVKEVKKWVKKKN